MNAVAKAFVQPAAETVAVAPAAPVLAVVPTAARPNALAALWDAVAPVLFGAAMVALCIAGLFVAAHGGSAYASFAGFAFTGFGLTMILRYYIHKGA